MTELDDLKRRGLVKQTTGDLAARLATPTTFYVGFDPTADSLHVGHLIATTAIKRLVEAGHRAIVLIGDATARIGDPSGKRTARPMLTDDEIEHNALAIEHQIMRLLALATADGQVTFVRNREWFTEWSFLDFARDIGSCFSVNVMLRAECFKARLDDGLSFLELSYMLMQAFDFLHLHLRNGCSLQVGGDDQWSNILAGVDLVRRKRQLEAFGMTLPLLVNTDGTKMGKTEKGTVWLSSERTSVFDFFQFWRNLPDDKVRECFRLLSFAPIDEIEALSLGTPAEINFAKKRLALELTTMVHGEAEADRALLQAEGVFEAGDVSSLEAGVVYDGIGILDVMTASGLAKSRTEARNLILGRGVSVNDTVVEDPTLKLTAAAFGAEPVLRKGKKTVRRLRIVVMDQARYFTFIAKCRELLGMVPAPPEPEEFLKMANDVSWFACFDDGLTPEEAVAEYRKKGLD